MGALDRAIVNKNGWQQSDVLFTGNTAKTMSMQANFPDASDYTVEFGIDIPLPGTGAGQTNLPTSAEAVITWKVEGNDVTRRVSVANGTSVTGVGQACKVVISDVTQGVDGTPGKTSVQYRVTVQVAKGSRASTSQPPQLVPPGNGGIFANTPGFFVVAPAGGTASIPVPQDAGIISMFMTQTLVDGGIHVVPTPNGTFQVSQLTAAASNLKKYDANAENGHWVPISPGTASIEVRNSDAVLVGFFSIAFGIDG